LRYSEKPEVNAFSAKFTTRCYNSLLVNGFWRSGPARRTGIAGPSDAS
jgi:hypothetical protein